jgi:hypothetical protein
MILAREATLDEDRRSRILRDPPVYLRQVGAAAELPHHMTVRFLTNTAGGQRRRHRHRHRVPVGRSGGPGRHRPSAIVVQVVR